MIKITVKSKESSRSYEFYKKEISIGSSELEPCDLTLPYERLQPEHIRIEEEKDRFIIRNIANDPFITLNNLPFGRRIINDQDVVEIGGTLIHFEGVLTPEGHDANDFPLLSTKGALGAIVEDAMERTGMVIPDDEEIEQEEEIKALMEEYQEIESEFTLQEDIPRAEEEAPPPQKQQKTPVILDLSDNDQEPFPFKTRQEDEENIESKEENGSFFQDIPLKIKIIGITLLMALFIMLMVLAGAFWKFKKESEHKVIQVSRAVADISLALTYAKIHHITPLQHNWSSPQFLKSSVASSLSPYHFSNLKLEGNGKIHEDYLLRIYTNKENSRFVIIAQPEPSVFHNFMIPDSLVVDSSLMTIRRVNDLKALNRLLIDPEQLHSPGRDEVAQILKSHQIVSMDSLADDQNINGFKTPDHLKERYPGAENYIYNSPRYSQVGERIMSDAIEISTNPANSSEIRKIKDMLGTVSKLPFSVIYTTKGKDHAVNAKIAIATLHQEPPLVAYIDYNPISHAITSTLVREEDSPSKKETSQVAQSEIISSLFVKPAKESNPLLSKLTELSTKRKRELLNLSQELQRLLDKEIEDPGSSPIKTIKQKAEALIVQIEELNIWTLKELHKLYGQHKDIPLSEFLDYVQGSGLKYLASNELFPLQKNGEKVQCSFAEEATESIAGIDKASNFEALYSAIDKASHYLSCETSEDPQLIIAFQNQVKGKVIEKLNTLLLVEKHDIDSEEWSEKNLETLRAALKKAWIFDPEEQNFYLNEFKLRIKKF